ncbi:hypothetical protein [Clostridium sp. B9]|uniref:hypothetical protein n=1 Tax=Clostridium sp. B9 TaxID=3423224 RepID=UPI003D2EAB3C
MKFKFLYLGNKTLEEDKNNAFRVLNCEEDLSEEIEKKDCFNDGDINWESRICFNRNGQFVDFLGVSYGQFINKIRYEINSFEKYIYNKSNNEEFNVVFLDLLNEANYVYEKELTALIDEIEEKIEVGCLNKTLFLIADGELFNHIKNLGNKIESKMVKINGGEETLNCIIETLVDFISYSELIYSKSSFENKFGEISVMLGEAKGENYSGEIIMSILSRLSLVQSDSFFELILLSADNLNLEDVALIEDALREYMPFNSELIIKQLTNKVLGEKITFMLFSK